MSRLVASVFDWIFFKNKSEIKKSESLVFRIHRFSEGIQSEMTNLGVQVGYISDLPSTVMSRFPNHVDLENPAASKIIKSVLNTFK